MQTVINRGYLNEDYRLFHSTDQRDMDFQTHSHDFHKVVFCLSGSVTYFVEGTAYDLRSGDILLVPEHQIHRSVMNAAEPYERMVLWINDRFLKKFDEPALSAPFSTAADHYCDLYRPDAAARSLLLERLTSLEKHLASADPGHALMSDTFLIQFLLELNNMLRSANTTPTAVHADPRFQTVLDYINNNLASDLSVDTIARKFYFSPSYLMHTFKRATGYSVHRYVSEKRLLHASELISIGESISNAADASGFSDYSTFLKAFRRFFGVSPSDWRKKAK